jgi:hypothetical protein
MSVKVGDLLRDTSEADTLAALTRLDATANIELSRAARAELLALPTDMPPPDPARSPLKFSPPGMPGIVIGVDDALDGTVPPKCLLVYEVPFRAPAGTPRRLHAFGFVRERFWLHMVPWRRVVAMEVVFGIGTKHVRRSEIAALLLHQLTRTAFTAGEIDAAMERFHGAMIRNIQAMGLPSDGTVPPN